MKKRILCLALFFLAINLSAQNPEVRIKPKSKFSAGLNMGLFLPIGSGDAYHLDIESQYYYGKHLANYISLGVNFTSPTIVAVEFGNKQDYGFTVFDPRAGIKLYLGSSDDGVFLDGGMGDYIVLRHSNNKVEHNIIAGAGFGYDHNVSDKVNITSKLHYMSFISGSGSYILITIGAKYKF